MIVRILKRIGYGFVIRTLMIVVIVILFVMMYCHSKSNSNIFIKMENIDQNVRTDNTKIPSKLIQSKRLIKMTPHRVHKTINKIEDIMHYQILSKKLSGGYSMKGRELYMEDRLVISTLFQICSKFLMMK